MNKLMIPAILLAVQTVFTASSQVARERNGFLLVEAEDFIKQTHDDIRRWYVINDENVNEVADTNLLEGASGGAYIQILPDTRVTHDDPLIVGENFTNEPGKMAIIYYRVYIENPGRYYVWARTNSRGTEDNGVHVGLNGRWPESGQRMQWCEGKLEWTWTSRQRTNEVHCGEERLLYLGIGKPGEHEIMFSMREDGFTMDQWAMTREYVSPPKWAGTPGSLNNAGCHQKWPPVSELPVITELPDPLVMFDGTPVRSAGEWSDNRRPELISLFQHYMYGYAPPAPENFSYTIDHVDNTKFGGKATLKLVTLRFGPTGTPPLSMMIMVPNQRTGPAPVFTGLNFPGNHTTANFPEIPLTTAWVNNSWTGSTDNRAHDDQRGRRNWRWPYEMVIDRGYAVATIYAGEISPDYDGGYSEGVHRGYFREGQSSPGPHDWGVVAAWAWGLQRSVDYIMQDDDLDNDAIIVIGHSRLGKAAMLAGALDERIGIIIPSQSGCGGTSPNRFNVGESVERINTVFPHWFNDTFKKFNDRVERLPFDQHSLIALAAPRPVLLSNATEDEWADPVGQFNMLVAASPVYSLLGVEGISTTAFPEENILVSSRLGYFIRPGKHDMTETEWEAWMDFCDIHLER
jgi:hypothetical protein